MVGYKARFARATLLPNSKAIELEFANSEIKIHDHRL